VALASSLYQVRSYQSRSHEVELPKSVPHSPFSQLLGFAIHRLLITSMCDSGQLCPIVG
jgi:hypothetical protein